MVVCSLFAFFDRRENSDLCAIAAVVVCNNTLRLRPIPIAPAQNRPKFVKVNALVLCVVHFRVLLPVMPYYKQQPCQLAPGTANPLNIKDFYFEQAQDAPGI